jgi:hypothetical protein
MNHSFEGVKFPLYPDNPNPIESITAINAEMIQKEVLLFFLKKNQIFIDL